MGCVRNSFNSTHQNSQHMQRSTVRCTDLVRTRRRPWALPVAAATLALCTTNALQAQVADYSLTYDKLLQTSSILQADEDAAFEPITGGTVLADGGQAAVVAGTTFGMGYKEYETVGGFFGTTTRPKNWAGNASFVGNAQADENGMPSQAEYQLSGSPALKTGPGYPIGFNFTYNGETFDRVGISGQGWIGFGNSSNGTNAVAVYTAPTSAPANLPLSNTTLLANDSRRNRVVATGVSGGGYNEGTNTMPIVYNPTYPSYPGAELRYETIGTAPNRVFVVQWRNYGFTINSLDHQYYRRMDFQIRLYETTNKVEVRFGKAWRSNTISYFQTGLGGKTGGNGTSGSFNSFGFYNQAGNIWQGWPYAFTAQANHNGYPGSTAFSQRIPWTGTQGYSPYNSYGSGSAQDYYSAIFTQTGSKAGSPKDDATRVISGTAAYTPDMMSFVWTPPTCVQAASGLAVGSIGLASATLSWSGSGTFDYAVGTGSNPATATFTGTVTGNSAALSGLAGSTNYKAWVRTNCGGGNVSLWSGAVAFNTLPCPVSSFYYGIYPISRVQISDIDNTSSADPIYDGTDPAKYQDFTSVVGSVFPTLSFPITVTGYNGGNMYATVFIDWDQDGVFEASFPLNGGNTTNTGSITGTIDVPATALPGNSRMRVVWANDWAYPVACGEGMYYGQVEDYTLNVGILTCPPPTNLAASNVAIHSADLSWTASNNSTGYDWEVRTSGTPGSGATGLAASGTAAGTTATATGLASNTAYTFYVRSDCGGGDLSVWMSGTFTTPLGCGDTWISPGGVNNLTDVQYTKVFTVCPENAGDVVTIDFTVWNGLNWNLPQGSAIFIYDGDDTNAPMITGTGTGYTSGAWVVPAGGWVTKPPIITSNAASGCLTIKVMSYGSWTSGMGWSANFTCAPRPTCFAPTARTVTGTTVHEASFSWNAGASPNVEYKVVAFGQPASATAVLSGTSSAGSATTAATLTANTQYTAYFRGLCDDQGTGDDPSAWSSPGLNFRTKVGCGGPYNIFYRPSGNVAPFDSVMTICPDNAGDVVTYTVNGLNLGSLYQGTALFVYNGPDVNAEMFNSGLTGYTSGANSIPAGGYYGSTYLYYPPSNGNINNLPAPFTSSHASGCLTVRFRSVQIDTYYNKPVLGSVTCAPAPACSTPNAVSFSAVGSSSATVSWGNTSEPCVIEYGPAGFIPGTGATAGAGTVASTSATSPYTITGLNPTTTYEVRIRQVCSGPSYSANSFFARFTTSMDCSTAQVLACGEYVDDANAPAAYAYGAAAYNGDKYTSAVSCFSGSAVEGNGPERLYRFTATQAGTYAIQAGTSDMGGASTIKFVMAPVEDGCAASAFTCIGKPAANAGGLLNFTVSTPGDYYIMSDANYGVHKRPFTLMCPGIPPCVPAPTFPANGTTLAVNTTPIAFSWPAAFGATGYDVYFNGTLVVANYPGTSITDGSYNTANMLNWPGVDLGSTLSWHVVPTNSFGTASCPTTWTFSIGGNGASNAIPLTDGIAVAGNTSATNGYSSLNGSFWGNDSWSSFTASDCADSAVVNLCLPANEPANYVALQIIRASDNAVVFPPADDPGYYAYVASGACFQYEWFNDDPEVWNWVNETPKIKVDIGETYYVIADGYNSGYNFTVGYNEISNSPDSDEDGIPDCADNCPFMPGVVGDVCDAGPGFATGRISSDCECVGGNMAVISITTDGNPDQITWQITNETSLVVASGGPAAAQANTTVNETVFLAGSCYGFQLMDSFGDGIVNGGWELRTTNGKVILRDSFNGGSASPANPAQSPSYGSSHSFCLPLGPVNIAANECGIMNNLMGNKVYAVKQTGTNYQGQALKYQFEFSDPDAGFIRRIAKSTNYVIFWDMASVNPLTPGVTYFARVRTDKTGPLADAHWGTGCEMAISTSVTGCPQLIQAPAYGHSCNETRSFNTNNSFIYATPVEAASQYEFRIFNTGEGYDQTFVRNTYILQLKWNSSVAPPLVNGYTYNVEVRAKVSGVWGSFCPSTCTITIDNSGAGAGGLMEQLPGNATLWPNPVRDGQVNLAIDGIQDAEQRITVDVQDLYGKQVFTQEFGNTGERFSTILQLPGDIASGVYLVNITVNGRSTVQRLSIIR